MPWGTWWTRAGRSSLAPGGQTASPWKRSATWPRGARRSARSAGLGGRVGRGGRVATRRWRWWRRMRSSTGAGCTTSRDALAALRRIAAVAGRAAEVRLLPDASVGDEPAAAVTAAVAPLVREPRVSADRVSEALHGEILAVLERRDDAWLRVRAGDGYHAWIHSGYVALGTAAWADDWAGRATLRSLGAELRCEDARSRRPSADTRRATCCASPTATASRMWRCGPEPGVSCTRRCRGEALRPTTCSPIRRRRSGCGSTSWRLGG